MTKHRLNLSNWVVASLVIIVLLGGYWLRVWHLNTESVWHDEGWSIRATRGPFTTPDDNTPYGYYATNHLLWKLGVGETPFSFRYGAALIGLLTVALAIRIGCRWYGFLNGLAVGSLVATSPLLWDYAQEVRAYVAVPLFALLFLAIGNQTLNYQRQKIIPRKLWLTLLLAEVIGIYTHNLVIPTIIWLNIAVGIVWLYRRDWQHIRTWLGLHLIVAIAYLPWLSTQSPSGTPLNTIPAWGLPLAKDIWYSYFLPILPQLQETSNDLLLNIAGLTLILSAAFLAYQKRTYQTWLLVSHALLIPILSTILLQVAHIDFHPRYYITAIGGTLLLWMAGISTLQDISLQFPYKKSVQLAGIGILLLIAFTISRQSLHDITSTRRYQHDDFEAIADYYATLPADTLIIIPYNREPALQNYYAQQKNIRAEFVNIPLYSDDQAIIEILQTKVANERPVEFLTWFQLPADVRGMYPCILTANSTQISETATVFGLQSQGFMVSSIKDFQLISTTDHYESVNFQEMGYITSPQGICVRTQWQIEDETNADLSLAMRLLNQYGWLLDENNALLRDNEQVTTTRLNDENAETYHLLQLPPAAPQQNYELEFTLYSNDVPNGVDVLSQENAIMGKNFRPIDTIQAVGAPMLISQSESQLLSDSSNTGMIDSALPLQTTILLANLPDSEIVSIALQGENWSETYSVDWQHMPQLTWHEFEIPPDAVGEAQLIINDSLTLATYHIQQIERLFEPPTVEMIINTSIGEFSTLYGATVPQNNVSVGNSFSVELIWQTESPTEIPYTAFIQLLDENGRLIAQSDQQPDQNQRPTTAWVANEYIIDNHLLNFVVNNYRGNAYLIAGFYEPDTFERVLTPDGQDHIRLPISISVTD